MSVHLLTQYFYFKKINHRRILSITAVLSSSLESGCGLGSRQLYDLKPSHNWDAPWSLQIGSLEHLRKGSRGLTSSATTCAAESSRDFSWRGGGLPNSISDNLEKHIVSSAILISPGFLFSSFPYQRPVGRERERVYTCVCACVCIWGQRGR